jgi:hypothetical protein
MQAARFGKIGLRDERRPDPPRLIWIEKKQIKRVKISRSNDLRKWPFGKI